jgi:CHAT domain-containing protein/tetratricopeptide (TPR) repeat protein
MRRCRAAAMTAMMLFMIGCNAPPSSDEVVQQEDTVLAPGQALYWGGEYDSAQATWRAALQRTRANGDSAGTARLLTWLGLAAMRTGAFEEARVHGEAALAMKLRDGSPRELARSYNALGLLAMTEERLRDAVDLYQNALASARAADDMEAQAAAAGNLGLVRAYLGDLGEAGALLRQMRSAAAGVGNQRLEGNALVNLGMVSIWAGDPQAALASLDSARILYRSAEHVAGEQNALGQIATAHAAMGDFEAAFATLDSALNLSRRHDLRDQEGENLRLLAGLFADAGDARRALLHYDQAAAIARELGLESELGLTLRRSALVRLDLGMLDAAQRDAEAALAAHHTADEPFAQLDDHIALASIRQRAGDGAAALRALDQADELARQLDTRLARVETALARARSAEHAADPRGVIRWTQEVAAFSIQSDFRARLEGSALAARAYAGLDMLDSAAVAGMDALAALERVRGSMPAGELRSSLTDASARLYGDVVLILLRLGRTEEAFAVADAARSRDLLRRLAAARTAAGDQLRDAEILLHRIDALLSQLRSMETLPPHERAAGTESTSTEIVRRIQLLRDEYESLAVRSAHATPRTAAMLGTSSVDVARIRAGLKPGEVLLHYLLAAEEVVIFAIRADGIQSVRVPMDPANLASRTRLLRELIAARSPADRHHPVAEGLYDTLIRHVAEHGALNGATRILIVPHGVIGKIPFAALRNARTGRYLIQDYELVQLPGAMSLPALRADVTPAAVGGTLHAFAPTPDALPGTRREAIAINRMRPSSRLYLRGRATESAVRKALQEDGVVHIAAHAVLNTRNPLFSRVELRRSGPGAAQDGRLELHEVLGLNVRSSVVVLSGCETGLPTEWSTDPLRPSGVTTLSQAFLHAGARTVMATLWRVDDLGSAELIRHFYRRWNGGNAAGALASAQRAMIASPDHAAPYYWAGFVISGQDADTPAQ